tara:strand:- start:351 stop:644 length:294 start_codon:yes stop_codon:yes gene_type:complete
MFVKIEQKLSKGFNSWKTMMLANGDKIKKYGMTLVFAGTEKEDDNSMTVLVHFESPDGLKGFGSDAELTQARIDSGVIMDQSKMTIMNDESVMNHKG